MTAPVISTTSGFYDPSYAARLREIIDRRVLSVADQHLTTYRYGSVTSIDTPSRTCQVEFPENPGASVTVRYGSMGPSELNQQVRVGTLNGDYYIADVIGHALYTGLDVTSLLAVDLLDVIPGAQSLVPKWSQALGYPEYKIQIAESADMLTNPIEVVTNNREIEAIPNLDPLTQYWVRLAAGNGTGEFGPYGAIVGPRSPFSAVVSDGLAPTTSPTPIVDEGLRSLHIRWTAPSNTDPLTYKVYASSTSGFTADASTLLGETASTFFVMSFMPDGSDISTDDLTYVRIIASDFDGDAPAGPQGFATARKVELGDVGNVPSSAISDGNAPASSPTPTITPGQGFLWLSWDHVANDDQLTYDVHISTLNNFTPAANTKVGETNSTFDIVQAQSAADGGGPLSYASTYYVKLVAKDNDGSAPAGAQASGSPNQTDTADIAPLSITAALIGDAQIGTLQLVDGSITNGKMGTASVDTLNVVDGAIENAQLGTASVGSANIQNLAVGEAQLANASITDAKVVSLSAAKLTAGIIGAETITLNGVNSIIQSSNYVPGVSGWRILGDGTAEFNQISAVSELHIGGYDTTSFHVDDNGNMWMGAGTFGAAPFRADSQGNVTVNNFTVNGTHNISAATQTYSGTNTVIYGGTTNVQSGNYSGTTAGWQIQSGGASTFNGGVTIGNGDLTLDGGSIRTSDSYPRVEIDGNEVTGFPDLKMMQNAGQYSYIGGNGGTTEIGQTSGNAKLILDTFSATMETLDSNIALSDARISFYNIGGTMEFDGGQLDVSGSIVNDNVKINGSNTNPIIQNTSGQLTFQNNNGDTCMYVPGGTQRMAVFMNSTAATTNSVVANGGGGFTRWLNISTSTEAIKDEIKTHTNWRSVQTLHQIDAIKFHSMVPTDTDDDIWGFSAEQLDSVNPALASHDDDGNPTGIDQTALISLLVSSVQYLDGRVRRLEGRKARRRYRKTAVAGESGIPKRQWKTFVDEDGHVAAVEKTAEELAYENEVRSRNGGGLPWD